jgi:hypothetical protein
MLQSISTIFNSDGTQFMQNNVVASFQVRNVFQLVFASTKAKLFHDTQATSP